MNLQKRRKRKYQCPKVEQTDAFLRIVPFFRVNLESWQKCPNKKDQFTLGLFRTIFRQQIKLLEKLKKRGFGTAQTRRLIHRARKYLVNM